MKTNIKKTWQFKQSPQEVWEYLTKPELLEQWLMKSNFQPIEGQTFEFLGGCDDQAKPAAYCQVIEVKPFTHLSYTWQATSVTTNKPFDSVVVWTLVPKENGTELQLHHDGFVVLEDYTQHENGWTKCLGRMNALLNPTADANTNA